MDFFASDPTLESYWRSIILFGRNSASYKFALAKSLIELSSENDSDLITLEQLAEPFSRHLCEHLRSVDTQGTRSSGKFLNVCREFNSDRLSKDELLAQTAKLGFVNVIDAFHVVNNSDVPARFFVDERRVNKGVRVTEALYELFSKDGNKSLIDEAESRWRLVETAWELNISRNLISVEHDDEAGRLITQTNNKRIDITSSRDALNGYQRGKCLYCFGAISLSAGTDDLADVDHFFPHMLKHTGEFHNLDGVWNLALACQSCNRGEDGKHARLPAVALLKRLHQRNEYLITSHHPLRETLIRQIGSDEQSRSRFLQDCYDRACGYLNPSTFWEPELRGEPFGG
ncbi:HNH endonuclease domain-containing protein [Amphritea sp.]|uniref:HNH endonuclease domain-containing protein n=1 Tax=Amphritea sp. TaxID=1872502 RepID=UPI0025C10081|nr:HNH endonuclease domain-containing protein [Amphritea sp.]